MSKILLAEDDANLREIFEMRLKAEGFDVVTAGDGEEALVVAAKEKPDLLVVDIMMPKISGFEMLETLRANPETANVKAIMMTALGQAEDRQRGQQLGVLKYLVKSQVTLEDFVRTIRDILGSNQTNNQRSPMDDPTTQNPTPTTDPTAAPAPDAAAPAANPATAVPADGMSTADEKTEVQGEINNFAATPAPAVPSTDSGVPAVPEVAPTPAPEVATPAPAEPPVPAPADTPPAAEPGQTIEPSSAPADQPQV